MIFVATNRVANKRGRQLGGDGREHADRGRARGRDRRRAVLPAGAARGRTAAPRRHHLRARARGLPQVPQVIHQLYLWTVASRFLGARTVLCLQRLYTEWGVSVVTTISSKCSDRKIQHRIDVTFAYLKALRVLVTKYPLLSSQILARCQAVYPQTGDTFSKGGGVAPQELDIWYDNNKISDVCSSHGIKIKIKKCRSR